jgi:hypothetical protein
VEARRSGLMELLVVTPLSGKEIVDGQWRALLRMFGWPVVLLLAVQSAGTLFSQRTSLGIMAATAGGSAPSAALSFFVAAMGARAQSVPDRKVYHGAEGSPEGSRAGFGQFRHVAGRPRHLISPLAMWVSGLSPWPTSPSGSP